MPRVRYQPFTLYEEVLGLKLSKKIAVGALALLCTSIVSSGAMIVYSKTLENERPGPPEYEGLQDPHQFSLPAIQQGFGAPAKKK